MMETSSLFLHQYDNKDLQGEKHQQQMAAQTSDLTCSLWRWVCVFFKLK